MTLYSTGACHLCEQAEAILGSVAHEFPEASYGITDISDSDTLFERYGWHIPVVGFADGSELRWPFDAAALRERLQTLSPR
ncbi:MAG: glutaredoxin family protein [Chromatocurvus sp.]